MAAETTVPSPGEEPEVLIVTGMSGAGRSQAASVLEDMGWFVVDNLPPSMIDPLVKLTTKAGSAVDRLAVVVDVRGGQYFSELEDSLTHINEAGVSYRVLYLDASDEVLVRRFEQVRRPHPLQADGGVLSGITAERHILEPIAHRADWVVDTSSLSVHDLARQIRATISTESHPDKLRIHIVAFGFKYGVPLDADMVVDMRFLANPYWVAELRGLSGHDKPVRDYVFAQSGALEFADRFAYALEPVFSGYLKEEKRHATIAVGCTGGRHRSVAMADELATRLRAAGHAVTTSTRDLGKE
ncbi:MAG: RNase adapter RapZ [Promicromonosporaceae bacterium]|nr:RNase adapter RapZ [Promicromonosporaceae bacterium]